MSNIFAALLVISVAISLSLLFVLLHNRSRYRKLNELLVHFDRLGMENKLLFSKQEIINPGAIALDPVNKKLLFVKRMDKEKYQTALVDLNEVKSSRVKRIQHSEAGEKHWLEGSPEKIVLQLDFAGDKPPIRLPFYTYLDNHILEIPQLESRAKDWNALLSRVISGNRKKAVLMAQPQNG